jgi:O-Antigen ligase
MTYLPVMQTPAPARRVSQGRQILPERASRRAGRPNVVKAVMVAAIWAMPLLVPAGPGNTAPADVFLAMAIVVSALWFARRRHAIRFPYIFPIGLFVLAGALAGTVAYASASNSVGGGLVSLVQDGYLLAWGIVIANIGRDPAWLRLMTRAWVASATCWALLMIIGVVGHVSVLSGETARTGVRAAFTLGDPNLAANYFICALLVLRAMQYPRGRALRWACCALIVTAVVLTGSNGGALVLVVSTVAGAIFGIARRHGAVRAIIAVSALMLAAAVIVPHVHVASIVQKAQTSSALLQDSIGRQAESSGSRSTILAETMLLYLTGDTPFGIGPAGTKDAFQAHMYAYVKMAHDDYTASLVERGLLGGFALVCLLVIVSVRCRRIAARPLRPDYAAIFPRPELLAAAVIGMFISATLYQVLHFRHLWALLGVLAAVDIWGRQGTNRGYPSADGRSSLSARPGLVPEMEPNRSAGIR